VAPEAGCARAAEAVVVHGDRRLAPTEALVRDLPGAGVPLRAVAVVAEEVRRSHLERRLLPTGRAVDKGLVRLLRLRIVRDRDSLVARERADEDVGTELFDEAPRLLQRERWRLVAAAVPDDLDRLASHFAPDEPRRRLLRILRLRARIPHECGLCAGDGLFGPGADGP